jgi:hypothetical protein
MPEITSLIDSADDLRVAALAVIPWCAEPDRASVSETYETAIVRGYDVLPVRRGSAPITETVTTESLCGAESWSAALRDVQSLTAERLVARESSVFRLLDRLEQHDVLFTLGRSGVDGVVTVYDLNQPAAHLFGFGLALICESDVLRTLRVELGEDPDVAYERARQVLGSSRGLSTWKRARKGGRELHVASSLMLGEKLRLLRKLGLERLADEHRVSPGCLSQELTDIQELRNALAHYDEDDDRLEDPRWTFERMRTAQQFADRVSVRETHG